MRIFKIIKNAFSKCGKNRMILCVNCRHFAQGDKSSFCTNKKQTNAELLNYTNPAFSCNLYAPGTHKTRIDYMKTNNK